MPRLPEEITRSFADSLAGSTPEEVEALFAEYEALRDAYWKDKVKPWPAINYEPDNTKR
jgi:hypothetical protein